ncbi:unnamed protein product, partial [Trichogramma brassicae]
MQTEECRTDSKFQISTLKVVDRWYTLETALYEKRAGYSERKRLRAIASYLVASVDLCVLIYRKLYRYNAYDIAEKSGYNE